jgi:hypothetical protein
MRSFRFGLAAAVAAGLVTPCVLAASVHADSRVVVDPVGDAGGARRLDVTHVKVRNDEDAIVVRVKFARVTSGDLIVSVDPRRASGLRLVAERNASGDIRSQVLPGAFTDRSEPIVGDPPCTDMGVRWRQEVARLTMPSSCLHNGDYGAIRFAVLTENGGDSDWAPQSLSGQTGASRWIARG